MLIRCDKWGLGRMLLALPLCVGAFSFAAAQGPEIDRIDPALKAAEAKEHAAINAELEAVAKEIATLLKHPGFRGQLRGEINGAKTLEGIIEIEKFLDKVAAQKNAPPGLAKAKGATGKAAQRIKGSPAWSMEGIDLYFPVKDHKAKWKGNEDLLVAYSPVTDETDTREIVGFSVKTGERISLDPATPPAIPVLIVAAEEHDTHVIPVTSRSADPAITMEVEEEDESQAVEGIQYRGQDPEEKPVPQEAGNSYVGLHQMYIRDVKEPWTRGNAEMKMYLGQRRGNYCTSSMFWHGHYPMERVDDSRKWYTTWSVPGTNGCGGNTYTCAYFDDTYPTRMVMYLYEYDGGSRSAKTNTLYPGVICTWNQHYTGDDYVDSTYMYRSNFPFNYTYGQDLGNAIVRWHKVH